MVGVAVPGILDRAGRETYQSRLKILNMGESGIQFDPVAQTGHVRGAGCFGQKAGET